MDFDENPQVALNIASGIGGTIIRFGPNASAARSWFNKAPAAATQPTKALAAKVDTAQRKSKFLPLQRISLQARQQQTLITRTQMKIRTLFATTCAIALCNAAVLAAETVLMLKPDPSNPGIFDKKSLTAKAGTKVLIFFQNQSAIPQERNFLILKPGTKDRVSALANAMLSDPNARAKKYIPKSADIIVHTDILEPEITGAMRFTLPAEAGDYPYLCTVPGPSFLMNGILKVTK